MGRGKVDPAPLAPINSDPKGRRRGERTTTNGERNRKRERERNNRNRETKKLGISTRKPRETVGEKEEKG